LTVTAAFLSPLVIEIRRTTDLRAARLNAPLIYKSASGRVYEVQVGFLSDLASVPRWAALLFERVEGETASAAVLHDWFYATHQVPRVVADGLFHEALLSSGVGTIRAYVMWAGVRLGGARGWRRDHMYHRHLLAD
jgi:hypothetical protein